jgi:hypothetical protein
MGLLKNGKSPANNSFERTDLWARLRAPFGSAAQFDRWAPLTRMKALIALLIVLQFTACALLKHRSPTSSQLNCEPITADGANLIITVFDDQSHALPGATVTVRSIANDTLISQDYTRPDGPIRKTITLESVQVSVELEGFYSYKQTVRIPNGQRCTILIHISPDPDAQFTVT